VKILHVLPSLDQNYGGPLRIVLDLSARALSQGLDSTVLGIGPLHVQDHAFPRDRIHSLPLDSPAVYRYSRQLRPWLRQNLGRFDGIVLHGMWLYPNWAVARECWAQRKRYACFPHGMLDSYAVYRQGAWKRIKKILYWNWREHHVVRRSSCVFFTTQREREKSSRTFPLPPAQLVLAPYGCEAAALQPIASAATRPPGHKIALFLGRIHPKKNLEFLLEAWHAARLDCAWHLVIAGNAEPAYRTKLERLIRRLHLETQVHLVGFVTGEAKTCLLQLAHWFLLPSRQENFGVAVLEAISHGCPVAISDQVDLAESLPEASEVLPLASDSWTRFLRERMTDENHRQNLIRAGRHFLAGGLRMENVTSQWAAAIESVFASHFQ